MYIYTHVYIVEKLFTKTQSLNLALALQAHFLEWRLTRFGKELFIYTIMVCYLKQHHHATQSYYPDTESTSLCPILIMPSARLGSDNCQFSSHWFSFFKPRGSHDQVLERTVSICTLTSRVVPSGGSNPRV